MKNYIIILFSLITTTVYSQQPQTDWQKMRLQGKVASLKELMYEQTGNPEPNSLVPKTITEYIFNENGNIISEIAKGFDSSTLYRIVYTYNDRNFLIGKDIFYKPGPSTVQKRYAYYPDGKLMDEEQWLTKNPQNKTHYTYNKKGELVEKNTLFPFEPDQSFSVKYKYDDRGNMIEKNTDQVSVKYTRELYVYDENGNLISKSYARKKGDKHATVNLTYEWDEQKNWTKMTETPDKQDWPDRYVRIREIVYY